MVITIPTWLVTIEGEKTTWDKPVRVPETMLDDFLHVCVFNRYEFKVERQRPDAVSIGELFSQEAS